LRQRGKIAEEDEQNAQSCVEFLLSELRRIESFCTDYQEESEKVSVRFENLERQLAKTSEEFDAERKKVHARRLTQIEERHEEHDAESSPGRSPQRSLPTDDSNEGGETSSEEDSDTSEEDRTSSSESQLKQEHLAI
jgi:hypothetical protein